MLNLGLTGGIGSGKSAVARMFGALGAIVLDADDTVRALLGPGQRGALAVAQAFGPTVMAADGSVNRKVLAASVFADRDARRLLESLLHPLVVQTRREKVKAIGAEGIRGAVIVSEAALIFEAGTWSEFEGIILVTAPVEVRRVRLLAAGWDEAEISRRMAAQWTYQQKAELADWLVDNGNGKEETRAQVEVLWTRFKIMSLAREVPVT